MTRDACRTAADLLPLLPELVRGRRRVRAADARPVHRRAPPHRQPTVLAIAALVVALVMIAAGVGGAGHRASTACSSRDTAADVLKLFIVLSSASCR